MSTSDGDRSEAASLADSMAEGPAEFEVNGIRPPDEAAANNAAPSEAGTPPEAQPALPAEALDFINASMSKEAAADVVAVLKRRGVTTPAMLESLDPDNCTILADDLADKANRLGLRAVGRFYEEKAAKRRRTVASTKERDFETLLRRLQDECAGKYDGFRVPGRFLLPPNLFFRLQKGEEVHLDQLLVSSAAAGDTSHKFTFDTEAQTFKVEDVSGKSKPPVCQSAGLMLSMARWGLSASLLNQLQPIHALCYMARVAEACLNCAGGISVMKAIDIDMRSEARRGSSTSPLGVQLTQEFGDIVARHSAAGQVAACLSTSSRTHSSDKNGYSGSGRGHNQDRLCHYFPLGKCHAGNRCKFKHVTPEQPAGRKVNGPKDSHQRSGN